MSDSEHIGPGHPQWPSVEELAQIDASRRQSRDRFPFEKDWPEDVWCIGINRIDLLGVDGKGNLYWDGRPVEYRRPVVLSAWQRFAAFLIALSAVVAAVSAAVSAYADYVSIPVATPRAPVHRL